MEKAATVAFFLVPSLSVAVVAVLVILQVLEQ